jgi:hypothetical protein
MVYWIIVLMLVAGVVGIMRGLLLWLWIVQPRRSRERRWQHYPQRRPWIALRSAWRGTLLIALAVAGRILLEYLPERSDIGLIILYALFAWFGILWMWDI